MDRIPCRTSVELQLHQADENLADLAREVPNFADEDDLADLVASDLREPLAALFATRDEIRAYGAAFGDDVVNCRKALEGFMRDAEVLERALRRLWDAS